MTYIVKLMGGLGENQRRMKTPKTKRKRTAPSRSLQRRVRRSGDYATTQLSAGVASHKSGNTLWHTDMSGRYWCGYTNHRTPQELLGECKRHNC